jgi:steroid delta-isomerase-like uncharacterized protein
MAALLVPADPRALLEAFAAAWTSRDPDAFAPLCAPNVHYQDPLTAEPLEGARALGRHAARLWAGFPDARVVTSAPVLADGRYATAPVKLLGTHRADLEGIPPTGRFVVVHGVFYCELRAGLLLRVRGFFDLWDAAVQLGVLPGRGTVGEKALMLLRGFGLMRAGRDR